MNTNARRWMDFLLPDALTVHTDWLRQFTAGDGQLLSRLMSSRTARMLLTRRLYKLHEIAVPERVKLRANQQWLLMDHEAQRALARRLGRDALHDWIRKTVRASAVVMLRNELGEDGYRRALAGPGLSVTGLDRYSFETALQRGEVGNYFVSVGAALLETTTDSGDPFCALRMRFAFSPSAWQCRPRGVRVDADELARRIAEPVSGE
jgi:hypothetical protein